MPKVLVSYVRYIESMTRWVGGLLKYAVLVLIAILLVEAVSRYVFNASTSWSIELSQFVLGAYFLLGGGYVLLRGGHIRMDIFYSRWSPRTKAISGVATFSLLAVYLIVFIIGGIGEAAFSLRLDQHSASVWGPPLAPIKIIITVGAGLLLLQGLAFFIRDLSFIRGKPIE